MSTTRRTLTLALLLIAAGSLAFATGAAVVNDTDTRADGDLEVQPADGPNGNYAYLNDDEAVTFTADGDSIEGETNNVTLAPNETVTVGVALNARGAAAETRLGAGEFSISATLAESDEMGATAASAQQVNVAGPTTTVASPSADRREFAASDIGYDDTVRFEADGMHLGGGNVTPLHPRIVRIPPLHRAVPNHVFITSQ